MRLFFLLVIVATLYCVTHTASGQSVAIKAKLQNNKPQRNKKKYAFVVKGRCAVIIRPDSKKVKLLKEGITEENYMTFVMDNEYYMGLATDFLTSIKVRQVEKESKGVLVFKSSLGKYFKITLNSFDWGILLFNGRTKPVNVDVTNIEEEYQTYMKK